MTVLHYNLRSMKHILLFMVGLLLMIGTPCQAQTTSETLNRAIKEAEPLEKTFRDAVDKKDYHAAVRALSTAIECFENLKLSQQESDQYGETVKMTIANFYYNKACSYALLNNRKNAFETLKKAIDCGYKDYGWIVNDPDLKNLQNDKRFLKLIKPLEKYDKRKILAASAPYRHEYTDTLPKFEYQDSDNYYLKYTRVFFHLDSVAGGGDEVSKIINILNFVHNAIRHDGSNFGVCESDPIDIYNYYKTTGKGVNCRQLAIALNAMYLAMGFPSRYVTCLPKDADDPDCHVICCVYSSQLDKWVWMDPTFNAYVKDEKGNLLSIEEVRSRLIDNSSLVLNDDANWNNEKKQTKAHYLDNYMAKNLYWLECADYSCFNPEPRYRYVKRKYLALIPQGFTSKATNNRQTVLTSDAEYFWQKPSHPNVEKK